MTSPRLTGIEFSWFTKCQMLASNYEQHWGMQLEPETGTLVETLAADARTVFTGPQSLQRVAARLGLAADAISSTKDEAGPVANRRHEIDRGAEALRYMSEKLAQVAAAVGAQERPSAQVSSGPVVRPAP
ncbi:hypothetical protein MKK69_23500 [Methylobacterium sp. J-026]|uniref:hypothetical protein n=1 Tax=Methylobacterium sp. J-026 TaxID=2836624 RepID=UPI001FBB2DCA|nr:hypothetical protein [Methylobacterium sp. J-026]MCJ2136978.1 hypothetical protein [Methylobacterium sp. J-026]